MHNSHLRNVLLAERHAVNERLHRRRASEGSERDGGPRGYLQGSVAVVEVLPYHVKHTLYMR